MSHLVGVYIRDYRQEFSLPFLAQLVLHPGWILFCPFPWILYSVFLTRQRDLSTEAVGIFAGTISLAMTAIPCIVALSSFLACVPFKL